MGDQDGVWGGERPPQSGSLLRQTRSGGGAGGLLVIVRGHHHGGDADFSKSFTAGGAGGGEPPVGLGVDQAAHHLLPLLGPQLVQVLRGREPAVITVTVH